MKRILVISPHCDDESYGLGGTILKHIDEGNEVYIAVVCAGPIFFEHSQRMVTRKEREEEFEGVLAEYGCEGVIFPFQQESWLEQEETRKIVTHIELVQDRFKADVWYVPGNSYHQDHRKVFEACAAAARPTRSNVPKEIYTYEHPLYSWNPPCWKFTPQVYEDITLCLDRKIKICNMYESQQRKGALSVKHIKDYSVACGSEAGVQAAERFEVVRIVR